MPSRRFGSKCFCFVFCVVLNINCVVLNMRVNLQPKVNGMLLHEKKVFVGTFVPRKEREKEMGEKVGF